MKLMRQDQTARVSGAGTAPARRSYAVQVLNGGLWEFVDWPFDDKRGAQERASDLRRTNPRSKFRIAEWSKT